MFNDVDKATEYLNKKNLYWEKVEKQADDLYHEYCNKNAEKWEYGDVIRIAYILGYASAIQDVLNDNEEDL